MSPINQTRCRHHPTGIENIFDREGNALQHAAILALGDSTINRPGIGQRRIGTDLHQRVDRGVERLDTRKVKADDSGGSKLALLNQRCKLSCRMMEQ